MSRYMKRFTTFLLALCLLLSLSLAGCAKKEATTEHLKEMTDSRLKRTLQTIDLSTLAAVAAKDALRPQYRAESTSAFIGDIDGDGTLELVCGFNGLTFDPSDTVLSYNWEQSGNTYYTDAEGNLYLEGYVGGDWEEESYWMLYSETWYKQWDGNKWNKVMSHAYEAGYRDAEDRWDETVEPDTYEAEAYIGEDSVTEEEFQQHIESIGLAKHNTQAQELTFHSYDIDYQEQLLEELEDYLGDQHSEVICHTDDLDGDGDDETVFLIPDLLSKWQNNIQTEIPFEEQAKNDIIWNMDIYTTRTGVILVDTTSKKVTFRSMCINGYVTAVDNAYISDDNCLHINDYSCYYDGTTSEAVSDQQFMDAVEAYLQQQNYYDAAMKLVDLGDAEGQEILCLCRKGGTWYVLVFMYSEGKLLVIYDMNTTETAHYLVEEDGKMCLLSYYQRINSNTAGYTAYYNYNLLRFNTAGTATNLDYQEVSFTHNDSNAAATANFFGAFNEYLVKVIVISDPFKLTNRQWMEECDYGTVPTEETSTTQTEEGRLGFVQIQDPNSWLNLREGPGTQYRQVLMDPSNPNSYVKQAQGSPVTILEEIQTEDTVNPVWVKIRIHYGDREVVGYSSKRFIREAE